MDEAADLEEEVFPTAVAVVAVKAISRKEYIKTFISLHYNVNERRASSFQSFEISFTFHFHFPFLKAKQSTLASNDLVF
jgi:hypothetical protein